MNGAMAASIVSRNCLLAGIGDLPGRAAQQGEELTEPVVEDRAVTTDVRDGGVLDERAVRVEAVAGRDVREDRRECGDRQGDLGGIGADDAAQDDAAAQVDTVGAGAGAGVRADRGVGQECVDRLAVGGPLGVRQIVVEQHTGVHEGLGRADLPVPPVPVARGRLVEDIGVEVVETGDDRVPQAGVAGEPGAGLGVRLRHGAQPVVTGVHVGGEAERLRVGVRIGVQVDQVRPEGAARGRHRGTETACLGAEVGELGLEGFGGRAEAGSQVQIAPLRTQRGELGGGVGSSGGGGGSRECGGAGGGRGGREAEGERRTAARGQQGTTGPGSCHRSSGGE